MLANWWTTLNDPELSGLIERAVAGNLDLKKAWAKVREARARRGIAAPPSPRLVDQISSVSRYVSFQGGYLFNTSNKFQ